MMYGGSKPAYKSETNKKKKQAMSNPSKDSGTGSCTSKGIRNYN